MEKFSLPNPKPHSLSQMHTSNTEFFNNLTNSMEYFNTTANGPFSGEGFFDPNHQSQLPMAYYNDGTPVLNTPFTNYIPATYGRDNQTTMTDPEIMVSSSRGNGIGLPNKNFNGKKRKRSNDREMEKPREVVHVRAKRGQATDSHSLAERLRREKINEKLRCLQDLVPGCYKTMGMAVMLDVIITYVRSLQNQIDFLSMKLSAASLYYDFNSTEAEAIETLQGTTGYEEPGMEKVGEGYINGGISQFQTSTWAPL